MLPSRRASHPRAAEQRGGVELKFRQRFAVVVSLLVLALVLVPAVAMAAPAITQGVRGTVLDSTTGMGIPFAPVSIQVDGGEWVDLLCGFDGTYSYATPVSSDIRVHAGGPSFYNGEEVWPITVSAGAVTTQDFTLDRGEMFEQRVYRFFNMQAGVHFYTASDEEFINVYKNLSGTFHYDGVAYYVPWGESGDPSFVNPNTFPLYRFYNKKTGVHFFTMSEQEKANVIATRGDDYVYEGVAYWVSDRALELEFVKASGSGGFPVYRFYVPSRDSHFFTADSGEIFTPFSKLSDIYQYEGVGYYVNGWRYVGGGQTNAPR